MRDHVAAPLRLRSDLSGPFAQLLRLRLLAAQPCRGPPSCRTCSAHLRHTNRRPPHLESLGKSSLSLPPVPSDLCSPAHKPQQREFAALADPVEPRRF